LFRRVVFKWFRLKMQVEIDCRPEGAVFIFPGLC